MTTFCFAKVVTSYAAQRFMPTVTSGVELGKVSFAISMIITMMIHDFIINIACGLPLRFLLQKQPDNNDTILIVRIRVIPMTVPRTTGMITHTKIIKTLMAQN